MRTCRFASRLLVAAALVLSARSLPAQEDEGWELVRALAELQAMGPLERGDGVDAALRALPAQTAEAARDFVQARVAVVPYEGSFVEPRDVRAGTSLNSLDRARYLAAVLGGLKVECRVVGAGQARVAYPAKGPENPVCVPEAIRESIRKSVAEKLPALREEVRRNAPAWGAGAMPEKETFWVQVKDGAAWKDLPFADTDIPEAARKAAAALDADGLARRTWTVALKCVLHRGAVTEEAFAWSAPAGRLHAVPVTYVNRPETFQRFVPILFVGSETHEGKAFDAATDKGAVDRVTLVVELKGPGEARSFERPVISFPAAAEEFDRGMGLAFVARLTVTTARLDDFDRAALTESAFAPIARALVAPPQDAKLAKAAAGPLPKDSPAFNLPSLRALALAEASHELADLATEGIAGARAHRLRPTLVLELDTLRLEGDKVRRVDSTDLLEPGTGVSGPDAETCARAALAHSIAWARAEDAVTLGAGAETSWEAVSRLLAAKKPFTKDAPPGARDLVDGKAPAYLTAREEGAGLRLSPGPTAVWILSDGSGGSRTKREPMDRVRDLCGKLKWASYLAPLHVMPYSWLISPIVAYHCKLAEAYDAAAGALDNLFDPKPDNAAKRKEMEDHIRGLGPGLIGSLVESAVLNAVAHGLLAPAISHVGSTIVSPLLSWANRAGAGLIPRVAAGGARAEAAAAAAAARAEAAEARALAESLLKSGLKSGEAGTALTAESRAAAEAAAKRAAAGETGEVVLRDITEAALKREAAAGKALDAALAKYYQGKPMPPLHTTDLAGLRGIARDGVLKPPPSGPNFSPGGSVGTLRRGGNAVRVRPESTGRNVDFVDSTAGAGKLPRYWKDGVGKGTPSNDIPVEHLEYFNVQGGRWMPIPRGG